MRTIAVIPMLALMALPLAACDGPAAVSAPSRVCAPATGEAAIPAGTFTMGADPEHLEEGPPVRVAVAAFAIDRTEVTVAQFARFVAETGYVTLAERAPDPALYPGVPAEKLVPSSLVFVGAQGVIDLTDPGGWWRVVPGANWRRPFGPDGPESGPREPVVHVGYEDALAYAAWAGRDLPTEAEWEYAARGGFDGARYTWGEEGPMQGEPRANVWQGLFPARDEGDDGYRAKVAPVGCYAPNAYGLYDMAGNVWEWTKTPFEGRGRTIKGGSFLCADNFCLRYRPSARAEGPPDTGASHAGFRTVTRSGSADR